MMSRGLMLRSMQVWRAAVARALVHLLGVQAPPTLVPCRDRRRVRYRHAEAFDSAGHGVRGVHAPASPRCRARALYDTNSLLFIDLSTDRRSVRLERRDDVEFLGLPRPAPGLNRAAIDHHRRAIVTTH